MGPYGRSLLLSLNEKRSMAANVFIRITSYGAKSKVRQGWVAHGKRGRLSKPAMADLTMEACGLSV